MPAEKVLWSYENQAQNNPTSDEGEVVDGMVEDDKNEGSDSSRGEFSTNVEGRELTSKTKKMKLAGKLKAFGAVGFIVALLVVLVCFFGVNIVPAAIPELLSEETDMQYPYQVEVKFLIFQAAMKGQDVDDSDDDDDTKKGGDLPDNVVEILKTKGILVGVPDSSAEGGFRETNTLEEGSLSLKMGDKIISADDLITEIHSNAKLYGAIEEATYGSAEYWQDNAADEVFDDLGIQRDGVSSESSFDDTMNGKLSGGSSIDATSATSSEQKMESEDSGKKNCTIYNDPRNGGTFEKCDREVINTYKSDSKAAEKDSGTGSSNFISSMVEKVKGATVEEATKNVTDALKASDTMAKGEVSARLAGAIMVNLNKMKMGEGNEAQVHETMEYLSEKAPSVWTSVESGQPIEVVGSAFESPSLYSILTGTKLNDVDGIMKNESSDRVLKLMENSESWDSVDSEVKRGTVALKEKKVSGAVGRYLRSSSNNNNEKNEVVDADTDALSVTAPILDSSMVNNSFESFQGEKTGEAIVTGMLTISELIARRGSGGTVGDQEAISSFLKQRSTIIGLEHEADRLKRSPFDITSRNTFLGSIVYNMAVTMMYNNSNSLLSGMVSFIKTTANSVNSLLPAAHAEEIDAYLNNFGDCETIKTMTGGEGTAQCVGNIAFFTDILESDPLSSNSDFRKYVSDNTSGGSIKKSSDLAKFLIATDGNMQVGITDGDVLDKLVEIEECDASSTITMVLTGEKGKKTCSEESYTTLERISNTAESIKGEIISGVNTIVDNLKSGGTPQSASRAGVVGALYSLVGTLEKTVVDALSKMIAMLLKYSLSDNEQKAMANGSYFANTQANRENGNAEKTMMAQFYKAASREMENLRMAAVNHDGRVAYNIEGFDWEESPVVAFLREVNEENAVMAEEKSIASETVGLLLSYIDKYPELGEIIEPELEQRGLSIEMLRRF